MSVFVVKCSETIEFEIPVEAETELHAKEVFYANVDKNLDEFVVNSNFSIQSIAKGH
jgi:hypothetical protein